MSKRRIATSIDRPDGLTTVELRTRIRMTKTPPAPVMDGVDVSGFQRGRVYSVESHLAHYLMIAGYATLETFWSDFVNDKPPRRRRRK